MGVLPESPGEGTHPASLQESSTSRSPLDGKSACAPPRGLQAEDWRIDERDDFLNTFCRDSEESCAPQ